VRRIATILATVFVVTSASAQQTMHLSGQAGAAASSLNTSADLPIERIGNDDLLGISVYDAPELTRSVRVDFTGEIRLPMLQHPVKATGLYPADLEKSITAVLIEDHVLVDPVVTVTILEFRSRPISVVGAVRSPVTFQASGSVTLLDAIAQAGGLSDNAGPQILVSKNATASDGEKTDRVQRIPVRGLFDKVDSTLNLDLQGGEEVRVPEAGKFYVLGNVHKPGAFAITDGPESSVLKAIAMAEGLDHFTGHVAYIYRSDDSTGVKKEIPITLKKIMNRKAPDMPVLPNDILYVPEASGRKATLTTLDRMSMIGSSIGTTLLYIYR
jgi:polysaccharide biosynthesis/export protein